MRALSRGLSFVTAALASTVGVVALAAPANAIMAPSYITGVADGSTYDIAAVPAAGCAPYNGAVGAISTTTGTPVVDGTGTTTTDHSVTCSYSGVMMMIFMPGMPPWPMPWSHQEYASYSTTQAPAQLVPVVPVATASISVPAPITVVADSPNGTTVNFALSGTGSFGCSISSGSLFPIGTSSVACNAWDGASTVTRTFTVTVTDPAVMTLRTPRSITVTKRAGNARAKVSFGVAGNDSLDGALAVSCNHASGSTFAAGTTTVTCTTTNSRAKTLSRSFAVHVLARR